MKRIIYQFQILLLFTGWFIGSPDLGAQDQVFKVEIVGEGSPILLIPGLSCPAAVWGQTVAVLSQSYTCHVITLPGFAGQPAIEFGESYLPGIAAEIITYIERKELANPIVIGHSLGGFLALDLASKKPELLAKIVVVDAFPFLAAAQNPMATVETMKPFAENMKKGMLGQTDEQYQAQLGMALKSMICTEDSIPVATQWGLDSDRNTVAQAMYDLYTTDLRGELSEIKIPTLVLGAWIAYQDYGVTKAMIQSTFDGQYSQLEGVKIQLSDLGKHFLMWDDPEFMMGEIQAFLQEQ